MAAPPGRVTIVNVPMANYLMIDGTGSPHGEAFGVAVCAVVELSAALRLFLEGGTGDLLRPMPLEVLWSSVEDEAWHEAIPEQVAWTAMVAQRPAVTPELLALVRERVPIHADPAALHRVRLGSLREGLCAQTAYPGTADSAEPVVRRLHDAIRARGYEPFGPHHEIYLADVRRGSQLPLRTILRQPIHRAP
jgi:hypothetical protein